MPRTTWLLGTLLLGTATGCSNATTDTGGGGFDGSIPADATAPSDSGADVGAITPGADATGAGDDASGAGDDASSVDAGSALANPSSLAFGLVACGSTATAQTFTVVNPTPYTATWTATLGMGASSPFQIAPASGTLAAKQSVQVTVTPSAVPATMSTSPNALGDVVSVTVGSSSTTVPLTETAQGAVLAFEPSTVAFGPIPLSLGPQSLYFAVQNSGNLAANVTLTLSGDPTFTLPGSTTTEALAAPSGNITDSQVTYAPTATTSVTGSIAMARDGSTPLCAPLPGALPLSGTGTNGAVGVTPAQILVGNGGFVPCGTAAAPVTVTLSNTGTAAYNWTAEMTHTTSFYTVAPASGTVAAGASSPVTVTPKAIPTTSATTSGEYDDTLTVTTNVAGDSPHTVSFQETAQGAIITRSTGSLGFGSVGVGGTITNTTAISFSNTGNVDATLTLANGEPAVFVQSPPLTLGAGTFTPEDISFSPTALAPYTDLGTVTLAASDDGGVTPLCGSLPTNLTLTGTGVAPALSPSPTSLSFGDVPCGQAGTQLTVSITNNGPAGMYTASVLKGVGSYFAISSPTGPVLSMTGSLPTGVPVPFTIIPQTLPMPGSTTANVYGDTLQVVSTTGYIASVPLNQTALGAVLTFSKPSIAFGSTTSAPLTVTNSGTAPATVTLTPSTSPFGVLPATPTTIPPSGAWPFTVTYAPGSPSSGTLAPSVTNTLLCAALPPNVTLTGN